ncbi:MAG: topoisomerase, partial [Chloroflexota bacterium]
MTKTVSENQGCLTGLLHLLGLSPQNAQTSEALPYRMRDDFLTPAEGSFYRVLLSVVGNQVTVCPKVGLTNLFFVARPNENQAYRNR